jgi:hypothetical protein
VFHQWRDATGGSGDVTVVPWTAKTIPIGAAVLEHSPSSGNASKTISRLSDDSVLDDLVHTLARVTNGSSDHLLTIPNVTVVDGDRIMLIKPLITRFWLQRVAMEDASRLALEIQAVDRARMDA